MKIALLLMLFALAVQAESVTVSRTVTNTQPAAQQMAFAGEFSVPPFDARLGTLKAATWSLTITGKLHWDVIQRDTVQLTNLTTSLRVRFRDIVTPFRYQMNLGPKTPCNPCAPVDTGLGGVIAIAGKLTEYELELMKGSAPVLMPVTVTMQSSTVQILGQLSGPQEVTCSVVFTYEYVKP